MKKALSMEASWEKHNHILKQRETALQNPRLFQTSTPEIHFLTRAEQVRSHHASYQNQYGCLIRLALYTGIRLGELLALRWEDIDLCSGQLLIRRRMYRVPAKEQLSMEGRETELVIQAPKSSNSVRNIPLLPAVLQDLMLWRENQWKEKMEAGALYQDSGFIATDPQGKLLEPRALVQQCAQIGTSAHIDCLTFHILRTTFAVRAIEQGLNYALLPQIMGYSTDNNCPYVFDEYGTAYMYLMGELFALGQNHEQEKCFPVVLTRLGNGCYDFRSPDFPDMHSFIGSDIQQGLLYMKECLEDEVLISPVMEEPTPAERFTQSPGELWLQVLV